MANFPPGRRGLGLILVHGELIAVKSSMVVYMLHCLIICMKNEIAKRVSTKELVAFSVVDDL